MPRCQDFTTVIITVGLDTVLPLTPWINSLPSMIPVIKHSISHLLRIAYPTSISIAHGCHYSLAITLQFNIRTQPLERFTAGNRERQRRCLLALWGRSWRNPELVSIQVEPYWVPSGAISLVNNNTVNNTTVFSVNNTVERCICSRGTRNLPASQFVTPETHCETWPSKQRFSVHAEVISITVNKNGYCYWIYFVTKNCCLYTPLW